MSKRDLHFRFFREKFKKTKKIYTFQIVSKTAFFRFYNIKKKVKYFIFIQKVRKTIQNRLLNTTTTNNSFTKKHKIKFFLKEIIVILQRHFKCFLNDAKKQK